MKDLLAIGMLAALGLIGAVIFWLSVQCCASPDPQQLWLMDQAESANASEP